MRRDLQSKEYDADSIVGKLREECCSSHGVESRQMYMGRPEDERGYGRDKSEIVA